MKSSCRVSITNSVIMDWIGVTIQLYKIRYHNEKPQSGKCERETLREHQVIFCFIITWRIQTKENNSSCLYREDIFSKKGGKGFSNVSRFLRVFLRF